MKRRNPGRWKRLAAVAGTGIMFVDISSCALAGEDFRNAAGPGIRSGVTQVVNGLLDGLFAVIEPENSGGSE